MNPIDNCCRVYHSQRICSEAKRLIKRLLQTGLVICFTAMAFSLHAAANSSTVYGPQTYSQQATKDELKSNFNLRLFANSDTLVIRFPDRKDHHVSPIRIDRRASSGF